MGLCSFKSVGLHRTIDFFSARVPFARSRSSKVVDFGTNRKRVYDFLLVSKNNLGPILHRFGDMNTQKTLNTEFITHLGLDCRIDE